jgi:hypothetical protein
MAAQQFPYLISPFKNRNIMCSECIVLVGCKSPDLLGELGSFEHKKKTHKPQEKHKVKRKHGPERTGLSARTKFSLAHCSTRRAKIR